MNVSIFILRQHLARKVALPANEESFSDQFSRLIDAISSAFKDAVASLRAKFCCRSDAALDEAPQEKMREVQHLDTPKRLRISPSGHLPEEYAALPQEEYIDERRVKQAAEKEPAAKSDPETVAMLARIEEFQRGLDEIFNRPPPSPKYRRIQYDLEPAHREYLLELRAELEKADLGELRHYFHAIGTTGPYTQADYSYIEYFLKKVSTEELKEVVDEIHNPEDRSNYRNVMVLKAYREKVLEAKKAPKSPRALRSAKASAERFPKSAVRQAAYPNGPSRGLNVPDSFYTS